MESKTEKIDKQISSVKLTNEGSKGLVVSYSWVERRASFDFLNENPGTIYRAPVNRELKEKFEKLKEHAITLYRLNKKFAADLQITGVSSNGTSQFMIIAKMRSEGETYFPLAGLLIKDETGYELFEEAIELVQEIYDGVHEYIDKRLMATPQQIVMDFEKNNKSFDKDEFNELSESEQLQRAEAILVKNGSMVVHPHEIIDTDPEEENEEGGFGAEEPEGEKKEGKVINMNASSKSQKKIAKAK